MLMCCSIGKSVGSMKQKKFERYVFTTYSSVWGVKSVQSALSNLKHPPECLQSQCNYRPFITYQDLNGMLSETKLCPNLPERNGQW